MKRLLFPILGLILALGLALPAAPAGAHLEGRPFTTDLLAGQYIDVGTVSVWNDSNNLYVTYNTTGSGWMLVETHLAVGEELSDIPQSPAKKGNGNGKPKGANGNPIPGQFEYSDPHGLTGDYTYTIPLGEWEPCTTELIIAAHAVVVNTADEQTFWVVSDTNAMVTQRRAGNETATFTPVNAPAVLAWEPGPAYPNDGPDDSGWEANSLWDQNVDYDFTASGHNADWIWESYRVQDPVNGTVITLQRTFDIDGYPTSGSLRITCDNGYEAFVNGVSVGSAQVYGDWRTSNLTQTFVDVSDWQTVELLDVSSDLQPGENTLTIDAANEYFNTDDTGNPYPGTQSNNPGGCIFEAEMSYYPAETAWGDGEDFPGANWATYFEYHVQEMPSGVAGDGWTSVAGDYDWEARARHGGAGGWRAFVDDVFPPVNPLWTGGTVPWLNGGQMWFELDYDDSSDSATFTIRRSSDDLVLGTVTDSGLPGFDGLIGIQGKTSAEAAGSVVVDNVKVDGTPLEGDDGFIAQGTDFVRDLKYLDISDVPSGSFTLTGDLTFTWGANPSDEGPALSIYVQASP